MSGCETWAYLKTESELASSSGSDGSVAVSGSEAPVALSASRRSSDSDFIVLSAALQLLPLLLLLPLLVENASLESLRRPSLIMRENANGSTRVVSGGR